MSGNAQSQDARSEQSAAEQRRRKRKERGAKSRTPAAKDVVSGAGQPLDPGVRRELEERLGHDLSRVRLHTGRDAAQLTELLGADAVAVGQDILFREGTYRPGTADGQRLLAHELLHTVQNPHGLGALRAGRDLGAVSVPQQAIEREAESAAQELVRGDEQAVPEVAEGQATPGWLRYATVDADRMRAEAVDPATLVDRLAGGVLRSLRGDPTDASGRVRLQLARMSEQLEDSVLERLEARLLTPEYERLLDLADQAGPGPVELRSADVPLPEIDLFEALGVERTQWQKKQESDRGSQDSRAADAREEQQDARARDEKSGSDRSRARADAATEDQEAAQRTEQEDERNASRQQAAQEQQQEDEKAAADRERTDEAADQRVQGQLEGTEQAKEERKEQREREEADPEQANAPGADKRERKDQQTQPAAGAKREELDPKQKGQPGPVRPEKVDERAEQPDSALSEHGLNEKDEDEGEPREEEKPLGLEAGADNEVPGGVTKERTGTGPGSGPRRDREASAALAVDEIKFSEDASPTAVADALAIDEPEAEPVAEDDRPSGDTGTEEPVIADMPAEQPTDQEVGPDPEQSEKQPEPEAEEQDDPQEQQGPEEGAAEAGAQKGAEDSGTRNEEEASDAEGVQDEEKGPTGEQGAVGRVDNPAARQALPAPATKAPGTAEAEAGDTTSADPAPAGAHKPAGAHTEPTPTQDRTPSPAARRAVEPARAENQAAASKSRIPKESGPGAAPSGVVGGGSRTGPSPAVGPGGAPSPAQAAVSPAAEQAENPGQFGAPEGAKAQPEASLEKDGGGCAPPEPAAEKEESGGSCGGGGGGAGPEEKQQEPPDVSGQDPKAAIGTVSKLAPDQAAAAMPGVDSAADKKIGEEQQRLDANPPKRERPSGAPQTQSGPPTAAAPAAQVTGKVEKLGPEDQTEKQKAKGSEKAEGAKPTDSTPPPPPPVADKLTEEEAKNVEAAADAVPTVDPELRNKTVGPAPKIRLEGESDPKRTDDQAKALKDKQSDIHSTGREDAAKPLGEDRIFPNAPQEELVGKAAGRAGGKGGKLAASPMPGPGVGKVAQQERGPEIQGAAGQAQGDLLAKEKDHQQGEQQAKQAKQTEIDREVTQNAEKQTAERGRAAEEAQREREGWRAEQDQKIEEADKETEKEHTAKNKEIVKARDDKDKEVVDRKDADNQKIDTERENAEKEAERKKEEEKPSGGFFGWVADAVKSAFNAILSAVTAVFDAARKAVNGIIDTFKDWADKAIDFVRDLAIEAINVLADALIAIGDVLLAAFPELRDKFRKAIEGLRDRAIATVNALADGLKKAVNALLDALAAGLNALLDVLEAGIKAVIKIYQAVILGAIKFAQAAIEALGKFAALVADIAPDPFGWLGKAGSSAKAGITDHLWGAIKTGVKRWFDTKVEGILGLGKAVINVLVKGCVSIKQIGKMAWDAIIASLPMMIASIVIEKVVSMLVPAAGAILTIVQGLMAAWQSLSSILSAFSKFWAYLKAVKAGPAACLFAEAVAAGIVALLDFIANFLMIRLSGATKGVGKRLQAMAQKIMQGLKKTGQGARRAAGGAVNRARDAVRKANQAIREPAGPTRSRPAGPSAVEQRSSKPERATDQRPENQRDSEARGEQDAPPASRPAKTPDAVGRDRAPDRTATDKPDTDADDKARKAQEPDTAQGKKPEKTTNDREGDRRTDKEQEEPGKSEAPDRRPPTPKTVTSRPARALNRVKRAVKSALKKTRNAGRTLGRKLSRSKVGRAVSRSAKALRDKYLAKIRNLHDLQRKQQKENADRRAQQRERDREKKGRENQQQQTPPTVTAAFSMSGEQHRMVLKPVGNDVDVRMASSNLMPLGDQYSQAYNNIEYVKTYINSIENERVRNQFKEEMLDDLISFQKDSVGEYKKAFKTAFPNRATERTPPSSETAIEVRAKVAVLLEKLGAMNGKISRWARRTGIEGFEKAQFDEVLLAKGQVIWDREYKAIKGIIDRVLGQENYKKKPLEYVGSLKWGTRGPHKGRTAFNVDDFDVDLFVVHPEEWKRVYPLAKEQFPDEVDGEKFFPKDIHPILIELEKKGTEVGGKLADALVGRLKDDSEIRNLTDIVLREEYP